MITEEVSQYTVSKLSDYLKMRLQDMDTANRVTPCLDNHKINGLLFLTLNPDELQELIPGDKKMVKGLLDGIKESSIIKTVRIKFIIIHYIEIQNALHFKLQDLD